MSRKGLDQSSVDWVEESDIAVLTAGEDILTRSGGESDGVDRSIVVCEPRDLLRREACIACHRGSMM